MENPSKKKKASDFADFLQEIDSEIEEDKFKKLPQQSQKLETAAREMLKLEREMTVPGQARSETARVEELIKFIAERDF